MWIFGIRERRLALGPDVEVGVDHAARASRRGGDHRGEEEEEQNGNLRKESNERGETTHEIIVLSRVRAVTETEENMGKNLRFYEILRYRQGFCDIADRIINA